MVALGSTGGMKIVGVLQRNPPAKPSSYHTTLPRFSKDRCTQVDVALSRRDSSH